MKQLGSGEPHSMSLVPSVLRKVNANFTDSGSTKSMPDVMGMRHTREVVGVKVLRELGKYCTDFRLWM